MANRIYKNSAIYECRAVGLRNLWEPSTTFQGKAVEKPNYLVTVIMRKTRANWYEEPALADFATSCQELYTAAMSHVPFPIVEWPIKDGDAADNMGRAPAEWRKGHWILNGSSTTPIEVSINQGGVTIPLRNRADVKSGDYVMVTTSCAVNSNNPRAVKCYINKVVFMSPGEEIVIGNSISTAELMEKAKAQGLNVTGFGGGAPQQGFGFAPLPVSGQPGQTAAFPSSGPLPPNGGPQPGFQQGFAFAPTQAPPAGQPATGQFGNSGPASGSAFPSSGPQQGLAPSPISPPAGQGFGSSGSFTPPQGFPPRQ
jgi:Protein of unknown function (DUF2815)